MKIFSDYINTPRAIKVILIVLFLALLVSIGVGFESYRLDEPKPVAQVLTPATSDRSVADERERITILDNLPVMLPSNIASFFKEPVYIYEGASWGTGYQLAIDSTPTCRGTDVCRFGDIDLNRYTPLDFTGGIQVKLDDNITGYYSPLTCGGSCGDELVIWRDGNYDVTVGIHGVRAEDSVVQLANFIISNQN